MAGEIRTYRDLVAWKKAFEVGTEVYRLTSRFPGHERFGLTSQMRRAAISIASNIAEGYGRQKRADYLRFLRVSRGSIYEVETQIRFANAFGYIAEDDVERVEKLIAECERVLAGLIRSLERNQ